MIPSSQRHPTRWLLTTLSSLVDLRPIYACWWQVATFLEPYGLAQLAPYLYPEKWTDKMKESLLHRRVRIFTSSRTVPNGGGIRLDRGSAVSLFRLTMIARILRVDLILICNRMPPGVLLPDDVMAVFDGYLQSDPCLPTSERLFWK